MRDFLDDSDVPADSLSRIFVETRHSKVGFEHLDALFDEPRTENHAWGAAIMGGWRSGKTTIVKHYIRRRAEVTGKTLKALYVELSSEVTPANISRTILEVLGDPNPDYGTALQRKGRVIEALIRRAYDVIICDEAHYLVDSQTTRVQDNGVAWFNELLNKARIPLLLIGYADRLTMVMSRNGSLAGRLLPFPPFCDLSLHVADDMLEVRYILGELERHLGLPTRSFLNSEYNASRILVACSGRVGLINQYLTHARSLARSANNSCLTEATLRKAAAELLRQRSPTAFNPFDVQDEKDFRNRAEAIGQSSAGATRALTKGSGRV